MTREEYRDLEPTQRALSHLDEAQALVEDATTSIAMENAASASIGIAVFRSHSSTRWP